MVRVTVNSTFKKQNQKLIPASAKRGTISAVNVGARTVDVTFQENPQTVIRSIPLSGSINAMTLAPGMVVGIDTYNETNPNSMVVTYVIGQQSPTPSAVNPNTKPTSSGFPGLQGQIAWDASFLYICISNGVWRRVAISSF